MVGTENQQLFVEQENDFVQPSSPLHVVLLRGNLHLRYCIAELGKRSPLRKVDARGGGQLT